MLSAGLGDYFNVLLLQCSQLGLLGAGLELTRPERLPALWRKKTPADLQGRSPPWPCRGYSCSNLSLSLSLPVFMGNRYGGISRKSESVTTALGGEENTIISGFLSTWTILSFMLIPSSLLRVLSGRCSKLEAAVLACSCSSQTISRQQLLQCL